MKRFIILLIGALPFFAFAGGGENAATEDHAALFAQTFFWIACIVVLAKVGVLLERIKQPAVLGELIVGIVLGNLGLIGIRFFEPIGSNILIQFLAELGVVLLLFQIGLESNLGEMRKVGIPSFLVAVVGVVVPFALGTYVVGPWLLPSLPFVAHLFLGATLTATSVGITARVFQDLGQLQLREAKIVLGAAVIDDVLGLIILGVVSAIVVAGSVSVGSVALITVKALGFLVGAVIVGQWIAPKLGWLFAKITTGVGMKMALALFVGFSFAYGASLVGLAPIVGAFAAGLILDPVHFRGFSDPEFIMDLRRFAGRHIASSEIQKDVHDIIHHHSHRHVEDLMHSIGHLFIPIFFVITGFHVQLNVFGDMSVVLLALGITVAAVLGKIVSGLVTAKGTSRLLVGCAMIPRGEVGLIFASIGKALGVVDERVFAAIVIMVVCTTLITPPLLAVLVRRQKSVA